MSQTESTGDMRLDELKLMAHGIPDPRVFDVDSDVSLEVESERDRAALTEPFAGLRDPT
jgi:hypothetical protein